MQEPAFSRAKAGRSVAVRAFAMLAIGVALYAFGIRNFAASANAKAANVPPSSSARSTTQSALAFASATSANRALASASNPTPSARRFTGRVGADLSKSLLAAGVPETQGREYIALLGRAIQLENGLSVDDRFDLVIERDARGKLGQLVYAGLDRVARADVELMKWTDGRNVIWVNADALDQERSDGFGLPVHGRLTSGFGERFHPILGYMRFHKGVDLAASAGTPIVAAADGRIVAAGWRGGYGEEVQIAHSNGLDTIYGHMSRIAARAGEEVRKGEVIGYVGSTGLSTGPHLHFEVTRNGRPVNPMNLRMTDVPGRLEGEKLLAFQNDLRALLLLPAGGSGGGN